MKSLLIAVVLSIPMLAERLPDAPSSAITPVAPGRIEIEQPKFWDRQQKIAFWTTAGLRTFDAVQTCVRHEDPWVDQNGWTHETKEEWMPTTSCAGVSLWIAAGHGAQTLAQYWAYKKGKKKLYRAIPWVAGALTTVAITHSLTVTKHKPPLKL